MFVVITGDLFDGIVDVFGPFDSKEQAEDFGEAHNLGHFNWSVHEVLGADH